MTRTEHKAFLGQIESTETCSINPILKTQLLECSPQELIDYLRQMEKEGKLSEFLALAATDYELRALVSYWQKWLEEEKKIPNGKKYSRQFDELVQQTERHASENSVFPLNLDQRFEPKELGQILSGITNVQPTFGCYGCHFCAFDGLKRPRAEIEEKKMDPNKLENLLRERAKYTSRYVTLHFASSPDSYEEWMDIATVVHILHGVWPDFFTRNFSKRNLERLIAYPGLVRLSNWGVDPASAVGQRIKKLVEQRNEQGLKTEAPFENSETFNLGINYDGSEKGSISGRSMGLIVTPRGLYSCLGIKFPTWDHPQGHIVIPFEGLSSENMPPKPEVGKNIKTFMRWGITGKKCSYSENVDNEVVFAYDGFIFYYGSQTWFVEIDENGVIKSLRDSEQAMEEENLLFVSFFLISASKNLDFLPKYLDKIIKLLLAEYDKNIVMYKEHKMVIEGLTDYIVNRILVFLPPELLDVNIDELQTGDEDLLKFHKLFTDFLDCIKTAGMETDASFLEKALEVLKPRIEQIRCRERIATSVIENPP